MLFAHVKAYQRDCARMCERVHGCVCEAGGGAEVKEQHRHYTDIIKTIYYIIHNKFFLSVISH